MSKLLSQPWALPAFSILAAAVFLAVHFSANSWTEDPNLTRDGDFDKGGSAQDEPPELSDGGFLTDEWVRPFTYVPTSTPNEGEYFVPIPTTIVENHSIPPPVGEGEGGLWQWSPSVFAGGPTPDPALLIDPATPPSLKESNQWQWNVEYGEPTPDPAQLLNPATPPSMKTNDGSPVVVKWTIPFGQPTPDPAKLTDPATPPYMVTNEGSPVVIKWNIPFGRPTPDPATIGSPATPPALVSNQGSPVVLKWNIPLGQPTPDPAEMFNPATAPYMVLDPTQGSPVNINWNLEFFPEGEPTPDPAVLLQPATPPEWKQHPGSPVTITFPLPGPNVPPSRPLEVVVTTPPVVQPSDPPVTLSPTQPGETRVPTPDPTPKIEVPKLTNAPSQAPVTLSPTRPGETRAPLAPYTFVIPTEPPVTLSPTRPGETRAPVAPYSFTIPTDPPIDPPTKQPVTLSPTRPGQTRSPTVAPKITPEPTNKRPLELGKTPIPTAPPIIVDPTEPPQEPPTTPKEPEPTEPAPVPEPNPEPVPAPVPAPVDPNPPPINPPPINPPPINPPPINPPPINPPPINPPPINPPPINPPPFEPRPNPPPINPPPVEPRPNPPPINPPPFEPRPNPPPINPPPFEPRPNPPPINPPPFEPRPNPPPINPAPVEPRPYPPPTNPAPYNPPTIVWAPQPAPNWNGNPTVVIGPGGVNPAPYPPPQLHNQVFLEGCDPHRCSLNEDAEFHSMSNEDEAIFELFYTNPIKCCRVIVEIGAGDGEHYSFSRYFEEALNWKSLLIEANPQHYNELKFNREEAASENGAFCESSYMEYYEDSSTFSSLGGAIEISSELHSPPQAGKTPQQVPCLKMHDLFTKHGITKVDVMVIRLQGDALAFIRSMDWTVRVDIWVVLMHGGTDTDRNMLVGQVLQRNEYHMAWWDIRRWCVQNGMCLNNQVFLRKGVNPLPCEDLYQHTNVGSAEMTRRLQTDAGSAPGLPGHLRRK